MWCLGIAVPNTSVCADINFNRDIRPILADSCFECHGPDPESREADLRLDVLDDAIGWVIDPGNPSESELLVRLQSQDAGSVMPPPHSKRRPTAEQITMLRNWIAAGAPHEKHWAYVPPRHEEIPTSKDDRWLRNPVDAFVKSHLESVSLSPSRDARPRVLARRLSLALTGLPVLPDRAERFVRDYQKNPQPAVESFVDELLASEAYGEHQAWYWMDAARYADTNGYQADGYRVMWPWRDWLIRSLNANMPFDELTRQMLAGDLMIPRSDRDWQSADWIEDEQKSDLLIATGFLRNHRYDTGSGTIPAEAKFENATDRLETMSSVWMGTTMQCARCHTHKYDPIENDEYYELLSFFDNVPEIGAALKGASHPYIHTPTSEQRSQLKSLQDQVAAAKSELLAVEPQIAAEQEKWEEKLRFAGMEGTVKRKAISPDPTNATRVRKGMRYRYLLEPTSFNGKGSQEESNAPVSLCAGEQTWTISFWFRPESNHDGAIFSSVQEPERYRQGIQADWKGKKIRLRHVCRWVNSYIEFESKYKLTPGKWYHVTFRCDGRMQGIAYSASLNGKDGAMVCTHPVADDSARTPGKAPLVIGDSPFLPGFIGQIHDLRFYDRLLTSQEVHSLSDKRTTIQIASDAADQRTPRDAVTLRLAFLESGDLPDDLRELHDRYVTVGDELRKAIRSTPTTMVMTDTETTPTRIRKSGVFDSLGATVKSDTPQFLPPLVNNAGADDNLSSTTGYKISTTGSQPAASDIWPGKGEPSRLDLANWLTHPSHSLTARVAVNRIWQSLWGRGFVDSPENFGTQCPEPLHSELLDWLAIEYVRLGWDTKALIRLIVTSRTYQQSSDASLEQWQQDPDNRHLARGPRFRLPIQTIRDSALLISGRLDSKVGGPPVVIDEVIGQNGKTIKLPLESNDRRRTLYTFWKRNSPHPMLAVFDVADRNQCEVRLQRTNTPLQALVTLNEHGFVAAARGLAERARQIADTESEQLSWAWQACTGRHPSDYEVDKMKQMLRKYCQLTHGNETHSWTAVCNVLLNMDATLTLE